MPAAPHRLFLASVLLLACAAGCQSPNSNSSVSGRFWRNPFRRDARDVAAERARKAEEAEAPPDIGDPTELSLLYAHLMEERKNLPEARRHYSQVAERKPKNVEAVLGLARIDQASGMTYEAEQGFLKALRLDPSSPEALHALGQFYGSQERWPEAVETLNKAMLSAPAERQYRYDLAVAMVRAGDINGALPHFIRTVGDAEAHYNVGYILHQAGRLPEAEQQMLLAVMKKPNLHEAQVWLDEIRRSQGSAYPTAQAPQEIRVAVAVRSPAGRAAIAAAWRVRTGRPGRRNAVAAGRGFSAGPPAVQRPAAAAMA